MFVVVLPFLRIQNWAFCGCLAWGRLAIGLGEDGVDCVFLQAAIRQVGVWKGFAKHKSTGFL